ncbi:MAG TPA: hypothetical protein VFP84_05950 [Kofleriaceae bacterium]|nr:hypothetical protein [Kofleriaceae bacterium]
MRTTLSLCLLGALATLGPATASAQPGPPSGAPSSDAPVSDAPRPDVPPPNPAQANAPTAAPGNATSNAPGAATPAASASAAPDDDAVRQAKRDLDSAASAQGRGDYDKAIVYYRKAYRVLPHPAVLFAAAQAYRLSDQPQHALGMFKRYLQVAPDGPNAAFARQVVERLELHAVEPLYDPVFDDPNAAREQPPAPLPAAEAESHANTAEIAKWTFVGSAAAAVAAGGYYAYARHEVGLHIDRGRTRRDEAFDSNCPDGVTRSPGFQRACTWQSRANIALYTMIGATVVSFGSLLVWMHERGITGRNEEYNRFHQASITPVVTPNGGGATFSMGF